MIHHHVSGHSQEWCVSLFVSELNISLIHFGWTKTNWLERDFNLRPPYWLAGALPTELISLFGVPVRSHSTIHCPPMLRYNLRRGSKGMHHKGIRLFFYLISCNKPQGKLTGYIFRYIFRYILDEQRKNYSSGIWTCDLWIEVIQPCIHKN